jgi:hypothetical protein
VGGGQDRGNRIDNRARGNAAQLLEKYKALARDAQMQGDRVNTEYYLQFADHYFRVLSESRSRFEEQQPRPRREEYVAQPDEEYGDEGERVAGEERRQPQPEQPIFAMRETDGQRDFGDRPAGADGNRADDGDDRPRRRQPSEDRRPVRAEAEADDADEAQPTEEARPVRRRGRPPKAQPSEQIEVDRLPPSFSLQAQDEEGEEPAAKPRRTRRPRGETATA